MKVSTELLVATRHRRDMTEKLLKNKQQLQRMPLKRDSNGILFQTAARGIWRFVPVLHRCRFFYGQACASEPLSDTLSSTGCVIFTQITQSASKSANM